MEKVAAHHDKQAKLLAEMIDKRIDVRVAAVERTVTKMYALLKQLKASSSAARLARLEKGLQAVRETLDDLNVKKLEEDVFRQINKVASQLAASSAAGGRAAEGADIELSDIKKRLEDFAEFEKEFMAADLAGLRRDLEAVATKAQWLEMELEKINLRPLIDTIKELESRLETLKLAHPLIIE